MTEERIKNAISDLSLILKSSDLYQSGKFDDSFMLIKEIVNKAIPKKPVAVWYSNRNGRSILTKWECSCGCLHSIDYGDTYCYCPDCGRRIDWSDK